MIVEKIRQMYGSAEISTKIAVTYAACFLILLLILNAVMYFGTFRALYRPAERSIKYSMQSVKELLENLEQDTAAVNPNTIREPLVTGVVLRVVDDDGNVFIDTDKNYPSAETVAQGILKDPPIFASNDMDVAEVEGALIYRAKMDYTYDGQHVTIYFYRTITSEEFLLNDLENILLALDFFGILLAAGAGHFVSRRVLKPIKTMTLHAQNIAFGKMGGRIEIPPADDELAGLARTFNEMLDRVQGGINQQQKFIMNASHELINPATAIYGCADLIRHYGADDKNLVEENLNIIFEEVRNMDNILQNLLFIARIDQNRQQLNKEMLELSNIVEYAVDMTRVMAPARRIILVDNDEASIFADNAMIRQLIRIFLENAVKNAPAGGTVTVSSNNTGSETQLRISNSGGLAQEELNWIFDKPFKIGDEERMRGGLEFSVAKWIMENHGIKIRAQSEVGATDFMLTIPTARG
ncbi:MAG: HAMP domain-containing protein [Selenomonadaceae bacterium]|nr:HAMP domain-containing protein [Selenomonadaceae bacterium]